MKIAIVDRCTNAIGGRPLKAFDFAECFFTLGHDVDIYFNESVLSELRLYASTNKRFWSWEKRTVKDFAILNASYDLFLVNNSWTPVPSGVPVICNWIDSLVMPNATEVYGSNRKPIAKPWDTFPNLIEIWLQSKAQEVLLTNSETPVAHYVIRPPKTYEMFRRASKSWNQRKWDLITVTSDEKPKNVRGFLEIAKNFDRSLIILPCFKNHYDVPSNVEVIFNPPRVTIADCLGNSKVFAHLPLTEVCPNVVYEALNAGCHVVTNFNGSMPEQIGNHGSLCESTEDCVSKISTILSNGWDEQRSIRQGLAFDRSNVMPRIRRRLDYLCQRIALSSQPRNRPT